MSSSRMVFEGRRQPEKSNFMQTCNLLSRYIKEKGSLRDLNIELGGKVESLEAIVKPESTPATMTSILTNKGSLSHPSMDPTSSITSKDDPKPSQLTIFYSGKMLVFDDYPADKAKELISFAKRESSRISYGITESVVGPVSSSREGLPPPPRPLPSCAEAANGSDLPIARRSSLHRFLGKRKDRAAARGPYHQVQEQASKGDEQLELKL